MDSNYKPSYDTEQTASPCSVVLTYIDPFGRLVSVVHNNVSARCLSEINRLIRKYEKS